MQGSLHKGAVGRPEVDHTLIVNETDQDSDGFLLVQDKMAGSFDVWVTDMVKPGKIYIVDHNAIEEAWEKTMDNFVTNLLGGRE